MATKKFAQMSTKKLNALLENASEEDAVAIKAILEAREAAQAPAAAQAELTPEEQAAIEAAESGEAPEDEKKEKKAGGRKATTEKMTAEELDKKTEECKENINHRCSAFLAGTVIRENGTIVSVLKDKRAMQVYYQIALDETADTEAKKIYKKWNAADLLITDEIVERAKSKRPNSTSRTRKEKMTDEEWEKERDSIVEIAGEHVGKTVTLDEDNTGRIFGILVDKRSYGVYFRIEVENELGEKKTAHKAVRLVEGEDGVKTVALTGLAQDFDEEGQKLHTSYLERKEREPRKTFTPEEKVLKAEEDVKKAEAALEKAKETLAMRQNVLELAKKALENKHDAQEKNVTGQGVEQEPVDDDNDDLA